MYLQIRAVGVMFFPLPQQFYFRLLDNFEFLRF